MFAESAHCETTKDDFEQNATAGKLDFPETSAVRREISKIVRASFDRACENNGVVMEKERRYRRRYRYRIPVRRNAIYSDDRVTLVKSADERRVDAR